MRRLSRLRAPIEQLRSQSSFPCRICRISPTTAPFSTSQRASQLRNEHEQAINDDRHTQNKDPTPDEDESPFNFDDDHQSPLGDELLEGPQVISPATSAEGLELIATPEWIERKSTQKALKKAPIPSLYGLKEDHPKEKQVIQDHVKQAVTQIFELDAKSEGAWRGVDLSDPANKFRVYKAVVKETGITLPDPALMSARTGIQLSNVFTAPSKPSKLHDQLKAEGNPILDKFPNVTVYPRRVDMIQKERAIGRWKVIEQELLDRGLPVPSKQKALR